jgi:hypothetical protein
MSMMPPPARSFRQRWREFWFTPGDPTTLGFIRIVTGLLVLYTHLAYSLDLQAFFGRFGWYGTEYSERERREFPWYVTSFWNWDETDDARTRVPDYPNRRAAVVGFLRNLPANGSERKRSTEYLQRVADEENPFTARLALNLAMRLYGAGAQQRETVIVQGLLAGKQWYVVNRGGTPEYTPEKPDAAASEPIFLDFMLVAPPEQRASMADDLRAFIAVLPKNPTDAEIVLTHMGELDTAHRKAFIRFLRTLPDDAAERNRLIDYLDYWNNDERSTYRRGHNIVSVWFHVSNPQAMAAVHATILLFIALFTIGFLTRVTSIVAWIGVLSYIHRNDQILFGMDTMMNILLVYLMVGNSGAALSVDRLIARYRAARASIRRCGTIDEPTRAFLANAPPSVGANMGIRFIQVHFCFIYMAAGLSKLLGPGWWNGTAFWDVMINPEFTLMKYPWFETFIRKIAEIKPLYYTITMLGVWFTWGLEISFPFLVWTRMRPIMVWMGVLLHAGIGVLMGLNLFELLMMTMLLAYFPAGVIRDRLRGSGQPKINYGFEPADAKQARAAALVAAADVDGQVVFETGKKREQPAVGSLFSTVRLLTIASWLLWIPGVSSLLAGLFAPAATDSKTAPRSGPPAPAAAS